MIQPVDNNINKPTYNAVKLNIKKPEINVTSNNLPQNGNFNAVNIDIDNPSVKNNEEKKIYDYPYASEPITYEMANLKNFELPQGFNLAYHTTNVILPKIENEIELEDKKDNELITDKTIDINEEVVEIPQPNYTTTEAEKELKAQDIDNTSFKGVEKKVPEIIPAEEILPEVNIPLVISNLNNKDYDIQAQQMEEIVRISLDNKENAVPYIVRDIFTPLINIAQKDTTALEAPNEEQINARKKLITNFLVLENAKRNNQEAHLPFQLTEKDYEIANKLSTMEMAERNKEYALYTISVLDKIYSDEVEKQTGNIIPLTDLPGSSVIVDALRFNPNAGVKIAALNSLRHINRPEYKEELNALFNLAQKDQNPQVSEIARQSVSAN